MATKYENYITGDDGEYYFYVDMKRAQTFTPQVSHIIGSINLKLCRTGTPGTGTFGIYATDAGGAPTGSALCSGTTDGDTLDTTPGGWREITLDAGALLLVDVRYAIVASCECEDFEGIAWRKSGDAGYLEGSPWNKVGAGDWAVAGAFDYMFEELGEPQGSGAGGSIFPSDAVARVSSIRHIFRPGLFAMQVAMGDIGFDIDIAEASVRAALDTAKDVEPTPVPRDIYGVMGRPPTPEPEEDAREQDRRLWEANEELRRRIAEDIRREDRKLWEASEALKKRLETERQAEVTEMLGRAERFRETGGMAPSPARPANMCPICKRSFATATELQVHMRQAHGGM